MVYAYAIDELGFSAAHFDVRKANERVWAFHERFGAVRIDTNDQSFFYAIEEQAIQGSMRRHARFLSDITIEP